jgi:methylglutamate dehydrogenase subunit B
MRIPCPHCGERGSAEFIYQGDASLRRPAPCVGDAGESAASPAWMDYVYTRVNAPGVHREHWLHAYGCRALLVVTRDVSTHEIAGVETVQ